MFSNTEYDFIGVHCGYTPAPGIILHIHTQCIQTKDTVTMEFIHVAHHQKHGGVYSIGLCTISTVMYSLILKPYPTPPFGGGGRGGGGREKAVVNHQAGLDK